MCPSDIEVFIQEMNTDNTTVTWIDPTFTDNSNVAPTVTVSPLKNSTFLVGNTTVFIRAEDLVGNYFLCNFSVTVNGVYPPLIHSVDVWLHLK